MCACKYKGLGPVQAWNGYTRATEHRDTHINYFKLYRLFHILTFFLRLRAKNTMLDRVLDQNEWKI